MGDSGLTFCAQVEYDVLQGPKGYSACNVTGPHGTYGRHARVRLAGCSLTFLNRAQRSRRPQGSGVQATPQLVLLVVALFFATCAVLSCRHFCFPRRQRSWRLQQRHVTIPAPRLCSCDPAHVRPRLGGIVFRCPHGFRRRSPLASPLRRTDGRSASSLAGRPLGRRTFLRRSQTWQDERLPCHVACHHGVR